jgi:hypothetical protein
VRFDLTHCASLGLLILALIHHYPCFYTSPSSHNILSEGLKLAIECTLAPETYPENLYIIELPSSQWPDWLQLHSRDVNWQIKSEQDSGALAVLF